MMNPKELALSICKYLDDKKAEEIMIIDVNDMTVVTDYMITCTARSTTHAKSLCQEIEEKMQANNSINALRVEGYSEGRWIVLDYASVLVHIFCDEFRTLYQLEQLWKNGENVQNYTAEDTAEG